MVPRAALEQYAAQKRIAAVTVAAVRRAWRSMRGRTWEQAWRDDVGPQVSKVVAAGQEAAAAQSGKYMTDVLTELGQPAESATALVPSAFAGVAGDGRSVESLAYGAVIVAAKAQYGPDGAGLTARGVEEMALADAERYIAEMAAIIIADATRAAETTALTMRPWLKGYIRMIEPGACSRCAVLAGKFYLFNEGFLRHPRCRCVHIPAVENLEHDPRTNPHAYFNSLSRAEQDRIFTNAGAEAIRAGADIGRVVNARRGMNTAQQHPSGWIAKGRLIPTDVHGQPTYITSDGVTKRGIFGRINADRRKAGQAPLPVRLMPESIVALAKDRDDLIRLLKTYGYIA